MVIAIDGPAGAGKSTIARRVAQALSLQLIDTGAIYRTVAHEATEQGISLDDGAACAGIARALNFAFKLDGDVNRILCNGEVVGPEIRSEAMSLGASRVSQLPEVREALLEVQRALGRARPSVLEGRDIGTVVFPDAEHKIFLTASPHERARRRTEQLRERGEQADYEAILANIQARDNSDLTREHAPLRQAQDAHAIDTTSLDVDAIVAQIVSLVRGQPSGPRPPDQES